LKVFAKSEVVAFVGYFYNQFGLTYVALGYWRYGGLNPLAALLSGQFVICICNAQHGRNNCVASDASSSQGAAVFDVAQREREAKSSLVYCAGI